MSARNNKERRHKKKQRDHKRQQAKLRAKNPLKALVQSDSQPSVKPSVASTPPTRELTLIDKWWEGYLAAEGAERLRMVREKLAAVSSHDEWYESLFPEAVFELENALPGGEYVAFLEELHALRADVFNQGADWHVRSMAFYYIAEERWQDLDRAVQQFADGISEVHEAFFSVVSLIRLAGRVKAAQYLVDAAFSLDTFGDLMPWAVNELIEWAMFARYQACLQSGATDEAIDSVYHYSLEIDSEDSQQARQTTRDFALRLAGKAEAWNRDELLKGDRNIALRIYLLGADFMRWLCLSRGFEPLVADELRRILMSTIDNMECTPAALFRGLRRNEFEPALARKLGLMSLDVAHAPAGIVAMRHFYDFLAESELVEPRRRDSAQSVCYVLWKELKRALQDDWRQYQFLEQYLPRPGQ